MPLRRPLILFLAATLLALTGWLAFGARGAAAVPTIIADCSPSPQDCSGWYRSNVSLDWTVLPATAVPTGCVDRTLTTDSKASYQVCSATDGQRVTVEVWIKIDKTPPVVTGAAVRPPDANGWYRAPVAVTYRGSDVTSGLRSCSTTTYRGPDSAAARALGTCTDIAGNTSAAFAVPLRYDSTGPDVTSGHPARKPDYHGWYNHPVLWRFTGRDGLSGLADCPAVVYSGPGGRAARLIGACRDKAGNVGARSFALNYDAIPPAAPAVQGVPRDHAVRLRIRAARDVRHIRIVRTPGRKGKRRSTVYRGRPRSFTDRRVRNGKTYRYTVIARDQAANRSRTVAIVRAGPVLVSPPDGAVLAAPPRLEWSRVRDADYFNVQLRRDGHKVLSVWPRRSKLQLRSQWRWRGQIHQLAPGRYEWDVWPGFGPRRAGRYGRKIGSRSFVIAGVPPAP